ncbi:MAG: prohibitin family protein [Sphingomonadales bacterium]|nr:prohibitin family protein [Sphingomonadales bacterium]
MKKLIMITAFAAGVASCTVVKPHQVAVKSKLGKIDEKVRMAGPVAYNPFITKVVKVNVRTMNLSIKENLPSKEGLTILSESSILYHIKAEDVPKIIKETGLNYEESLILPVFRSAASDVCSRYYAKDMHSAKRLEIEQEIKKRLAEVCDEKGFVIEAVLLKSISLPQGLTRSIEAKLEAEQEALRMEFVLDRQKKEMDRQLIEAEGAKKNAIIQAEARAEAVKIEAEGRAKGIEIEAKANKAANDLLNSSLTPNVLKMNQIQAFMKLSTSANTKTIITDGKSGVINILDDK